MDENRQAAAARLAEITGSTGEAVTVRSPDAPSLWRRARGYVAAAAVGAAALAGASQADAFGPDAIERLGAEPGVHSLDTPQGSDGGKTYQPVDVAGISAAMAAADEMPQDRFEASYPGRRFNEMTMEEGTKGIGLHVEGESNGFFDLSRRTCAVEYNPNYMGGNGLDRDGKVAYAQHMGAAICLHQALTEQPASDQQARVAQGVLAEALAERSGGASVDAVDRGLELRAANLMSYGAVDHASIMPEDTDRELAHRKTGAVMHLAGAVADQNPADVQNMTYKQLVDYADARTQDALDIAERSGLKGLEHRDASSLYDARDVNDETVRDAAMKSFEPDSTAHRMIGGAEAERDAQAAEQALYGYADGVAADQKPGPAKEMSEEQLYGYADTVSEDRGDDGKQAGERAEPVEIQLKDAETRRIQLNEPQTREIDLQPDREASLDLKEQGAANLDLKPQETVNLDLRPAAGSELVRLAAEGGERPDPQSAPALARQLNETVNPKSPQTFDPTVTKQLYTTAPEWFPAMRGAAPDKLEARADRLVKRDFSVALKQAEGKGPETKDRLAGFAQQDEGLASVLKKHEATPATRSAGRSKGVDVEM